MVYMVIFSKNGHLIEREIFDTYDAAEKFQIQAMNEYSIVSDIMQVE